MLPAEPEDRFYDSLVNYENYIEQQLAAQELPAADPAAIQVSYNLAKKIAEIIKVNGPMAFNDFMHRALYEPGMGYYASGNQKFGAGGDFVTAPEISSLFSQAIANQFSEIMQSIEPNILELGAGSGIFAADCLLHLEQLNALPEQYGILEVSAELQQRQKKTIAAKAEHLLERVTWLNELPSNFKGVVFANEVVDAIPVGLLRKHQGTVQSAKVEVYGNELRLSWNASNILPSCDLQEGQIIEDRTAIRSWLSSVIDTTGEAVFVLVDYGDSEDSIYSPNRRAGTLQHYYRHYKTLNPLGLVGMQDITSSVDFTQLAMVADQLNCQLVGYTTQNMFLMGNKIEQLSQDLMESLSSSDTMTPMKIGQQLKQLLMPDEMGETCKVLAFSKGLEMELQGFELDNRLHML